MLLLVVPIVLYLINAANATCGYVLGYPIDVCSSMFASEGIGISYMYTCNPESGIYNYTTYFTNDCSGEPSGVSDYTTICEFYSCSCPTDANGADCNTVTQHTGSNCADTWTESIYVKGSCTFSPDGQGSAIIDCGEEEVEYEFFDDYRCSCKEDELGYIPTCSLYRSGATDNIKTCGHYLEYPLDECSKIDYSGLFGYGSSTKYTCDSGTGKYYEYEYDNVDDCSGDPSAINNVTYNCEEDGSEACNCESSIYCDITRSKLVLDCEGNEQVRLYVTNVCRERGLLYEQYECSDDGKLEETVFTDNQCTTIDPECPDGYILDCDYSAGDDPDNCGYFSTLPFDSCFGGTVYTCDESTGMLGAETYDDTAACSGDPSSTIDFGTTCTEYNDDFGIGCNCAPGANCKTAKIDYCDGSGLSYEMLLDQCTLMSTGEYYNTYYKYTCESFSSGEMVYYYDADCTITEEPNVYGCTDEQINPYGEGVVDCFWYDKCDYTDANCNDDGDLANCGHYQGQPVNLCMALGYGGDASSYMFSCYIDTDGNHTFTQYYYDDLNCQSLSGVYTLSDCEEDVDCFCGSEIDCNIMKHFSCTDDSILETYQESYYITDMCNGNSMYTCNSNGDDYVFTDCGGSGITPSPTAEQCEFDLTSTFSGCVFSPSPTKATPEPTPKPTPDPTTGEPTTTIEPTTTTTESVGTPTKPIGDGDGSVKIFKMHNIIFALLFVFAFC